MKYLGVLFSLLMAVGLAGCNHDDRDKDALPNGEAVQLQESMKAYQRSYEVSKKQQAELDQKVIADYKANIAAAKHKPTTTVGTVSYYNPPEGYTVVQPAEQAPPPSLPNAEIVDLNSSAFIPSAPPTGPPVTGPVVSSKVHILTDEQATTTGILNELEWLVADCKPGDIRVFTFSGHGALFAGTDVAHEPDGQNNVICPQDFAWDYSHMITDKQLHAIFAKLPAGARLICIFDSCHSEDVVRVIESRKVSSYRAYPAELTPVTVDTQNKKARATGKIPRGMQDSQLECYVGFFGCQRGGTSADTEDENNVPCGALTYYWLREIPSFLDKQWTTLNAQINKDMDEDHYDQNPVVNGPLKKLTPKQFFALQPGQDYKALNVGINNYPGCSLRGCVNDAHNLNHFFAATFSIRSALKKK